MGLGIWLCRGVAACALATCVATSAQVVLTEPQTPLLLQSFGEWKKLDQPGPVASDYSLSTVSKAALEESGPQRSAVADYQRAGKKIHVEAIQFGDRTGAVSAYSLVRHAGMHEGKDLGSADAVGDGAVLFTVSASVVLVAGVDASDVASLKPLADIMPKVPGNKGVAPLLPSLLPPKGFISGSMRYAIGPSTYAAEGGILPASQLAFDKSGEAVTAQYADKRGKETLTLLLYPTPAIAGRVAQAIQDSLGSMGPQFATAKVRREAELVALASGSFQADVAQQMVENVHLKQDVAIDPDMPVPMQTKIVQTYSMLSSIALLGGFLMLAAVFLGLFLGGGRALYRVLRGKPAAVEMEFLGLGLSPQNKPADFHRPDSPPQP